MTRTRRLLCAVLLALAPALAAAEAITAGRYASPVERYGHFALGRPHEYARLVATTDRERERVLDLPADEVFEDLAPRLVRLAPDGPAELLAIISRRSDGSRLALIGLRGASLEITAQSPPIGTPMRWLNPVGAADLDGDRLAEIAAVTTPHIGGTLRVYRRHGSDLVEVAALPGFSNHVYGAAEVRLSATTAVGDRAHLLVPDATRTWLRTIALKDGRLVEAGRCELRAPIRAPVSLDSCQ